MRTALLLALLVFAGGGSHRELRDTPARTTGSSPTALTRTAPPAPTTLRCRPNQRPVPAGEHCQECGPLDGCLSSPATCRPACTTHADCSDGTGCDARLGACVRLCG